MLFEVVRLLFGPIVQEDPYEMIWIESQEAIFVIIITSLLVFWVLKGAFLRYVKKVKQAHVERLTLQGMTLLFESDESDLDNST